MVPVAFEGATDMMSPVEPFDACEAADRLPVRILDGQVVSCWRPSPAELAEIIATGVVWLQVSGREVIPRVLVSGHKREVF